MSPPYKEIKAGIVSRSGNKSGSKTYYECDTLIILRATLIILRDTLNNLRDTLIILRAT